MVRRYDLSYLAQRLMGMGPYIWIHMASTTGGAKFLKANSFSIERA